MYYLVHCLYLLLISYQMTMCTTINTFSAFFHSSFPRCLAALQVSVWVWPLQKFLSVLFYLLFLEFCVQVCLHSCLIVFIFYHLCVLTLLCPLLLVTLMCIKSTVFSSAFITMHVHPSSVFPPLILACLWTFFISELDGNNKQKITFSSE